MLKKVEKIGKNVDEALKLAADELGVETDELQYEVTQEVGKGLIGFLVGKEVTINAWLKKDEPKPKTAAKPAVKAKAEKKPEKKIEKAKAKAASTPVAEKKAEPNVKKKVEKVAAAEKTEKKAKKLPEAKSEQAALAQNVKISNDRKRAERESEPVTREAIEATSKFFSELLTKMGIEHQLKVENVDNVINVEVSGEKMGFLIGKRGDTLDAVQYLTNLYVNKEKSGYTKLNIDTENYRQRREETLTRLAKGLERRVIAGRRPVTLEPMSPYERRIIHSALQDSSKIKTYSVGNEPNRKVVVTLA